MSVINSGAPHAIGAADQDPLAALTAALVDANDRLLGLIKLVAVAGESLDESISVGAVLRSALPLLDADAAELAGATTHRVGAAPSSADTHCAEVVRYDGENELTIRVWRRHAAFGTPERKLLDGVATLLTNAVRASRLHQEGLNQAIVAREHAAAARLTSAVLPEASTTPRRDGIETFARLTPARTTGGDLYAWDMIDGDLWFAVGDVSGKGLPAAVQMTTIMSAIAGGFARQHHRGVEAVFDFVERMVFGNLSDAGMFVTLIIGRVLAHPQAPNLFTVELANAGHSPVVFDDGTTPVRIAASAPPVGVLAGLTPTVETLNIASAAALVIATDGFTEQEDVHNEAFGESNFDQLIHELLALPASELGNELFDALDRHGQGCDQSDDRTLVILGFAP